MDTIVILDFGGQYAHLIANRIRRLEVYSKIKDGETKAFDLKNYKGIILSGGPSSVLEKDAPKCDRKIFELGIPILGICYGHQLMMHILGGEVKAGHIKEYGYASLDIPNPENILSGLTNQEQVWMSHGDTVTQLPKDFTTVGSTDECEQAAVTNTARRFYGLQFHPEVAHTPHGMNILSNFIELCDAKREWSIKNFLDEEIKSIKMQVGDRKVFMLVSGGVDSTVAFAMLEKALGKNNIYGLFVDTGFMRLNERKEIEAFLKSAGFENLHSYDASEEFFNALKEIYDPEKKREIIGNLFVNIQAKVTSQLGLDPEKWILGQGTIYPDTIETGGTKHADKIKTHHNRVEQIQKLIDEGKVIEPLKDLYKDEVRKLGQILGLPPTMVWRHPFPGPGLAVRCLANQGWADYPKDYKQIESNVNNLLDEHGLKCKILPIKSVGVQGDSRTYRHPIVLYGANLDWEKLADLSTKITNGFSDINRVLYTPHDEIKNIELKKAYLTTDRISILREADHLVNSYCHSRSCQPQTQQKYGDSLTEEIWQFPVVMIPVGINNSGEESIVLRPVCSEEAMTASFYKMDRALLQKIRESLLKLIGISAVFYDITNKPPGTIEWE